MAKPITQKKRHKNKETKRLGVNVFYVDRATERANAVKISNATMISNARLLMLCAKCIQLFHTFVYVKMYTLYSIRMEKIGGKN